MSQQRPTSSPIDSIPSLQQAPFRMDFIWAALAIAILIGFAIDAHLSFVIGFEFQLGDGFYAFIQTHGHAQLMGWTGLFIIGISIHFIPRLAGAPIAQPRRLSFILWLIAGGILIRSIGHSVLPYIVNSGAFVPLLWLIAFSGVMEVAGIIVYLMTILDTIKRGGDLSKRPALVFVQPFFAMMLAGWLLYAIINAALLIHMAAVRMVIVDQAWNEFSVNIFIGMILLSVAFAFSIRTFPLYLRLPAPHWQVRAAAIVYLVLVFIQIAPTLPPITNMFPEISLRFSSIGGMLKGDFILWFVWKLDVLTRWRQP